MIIKKIMVKKHMKNITKIIIGISIIFLCIGVVSAANLNQVFKAPTGLEPMGNDNFVDKQGHNIMISEFNDDNKKTWFENDTDPLYSVIPSDSDPNVYIGVTDEDSYLLEVVEKDGTKYIVGSWTPNSSQSDLTKIAENLKEFNNLNKVTPVEV